MEAVVMTEKDLDRFVRSASEGNSVFGPKKKDVTHVFGEVKSGREIDLKYRTTILSPKKIFQFEDTLYLDRRKSSVIMALNCTEIGENCFCHSMGTGPECSVGFDLSMTDLGDRYLVEIGTDLGRRLLHPLDLPKADRRDFEEKTSRLASAKKKFKKFVDKEGLANAADESSCQLLEYASVAMGGNFRSERKDRMRQWMMCKLRYTGKEHGFSGCVGCGRCIGACTVHIDITQVAATIKGG